MPDIMPQITNCSVAQCAFNHSQACHAVAIAVGDPTGDSTCDIFFEINTQTVVNELNAGVYACMHAECKHNTDYECVAPDIRVGLIEGRPDCLTFRLR